MESRWRQNVPDFGWANSEWDLIARYLPVTGEDGVAAVRSKVTGKWWVVTMTNTAAIPVWFFDAGPMTFAEAAAAGTLEPDPI